jgi:hypothetical protein
VAVRTRSATQTTRSAKSDGDGSTAALSGFERLHVIQYSQDGGIDVNGFVSSRLWPWQELQLLVQANDGCTQSMEGGRGTRGSLAPFARGAIVTTSHFSRAAMIEATAVGKNPITLVDGYSFAKLKLGGAGI